VSDERLFDDRVGSAWALLQDRTDAFLDPLGRAAMARLCLSPGERVVDVGCGCGQTLVELAELVGPGGRVLGVDINEPMLALARARSVARANIELALGDAQTYAFARAAYDAVYSRFGVMFFGDPRAAFANLRAALRPGGRLAFVSWQELARNPWAELPLRALLAKMPGAPLPALVQSGAPGPFGLADRARIESLLAAAGFAGVTVEPFATSVHLGAAMTLDEAVDYCRQLGPASRCLGDAPVERRPELETALRAALAPHATSRGLWFDAAAWLVTAGNQD
jgi:SAM-dependent methyltransferase